jgi:hypothetical protein
MSPISKNDHKIESMNRLPKVLQNEVWEYVHGDRVYWKQQFKLPMRELLCHLSQLHWQCLWQISPSRQIFTILHSITDKKGTRFGSLMCWKNKEFPIWTFEQMILSPIFTGYIGELPDFYDRFDSCM